MWAGLWNLESGIWVQVIHNFRFRVVGAGGWGGGAALPHSVRGWGLPCTRLYLARSEPDKIQVARAPKIRIQIRRWLTTLPQLHRFRGSDSKEALLAPLRNIQNPDFRFQIPDSRFRGSRYQNPVSRVREEHRPDIHRNQDSDSNSALEPSRRSDAQKSDTTVAKGAQTAQGSMA